VEVKLQTFLTLALDRCEWLALWPSCFNPSERFPHYPMDRRLGGPQAGLDVVVRKRL